MKRSSRAITLTLLGSTMFLGGCGAAGIGQARNDEKKKEEQQGSRGGGYIGGAGLARGLSGVGSGSTASGTSRGGFGSRIGSFFSGGS